MCYNGYGAVVHGKRLPPEFLWTISGEISLPPSKTEGGGHVTIANILALCQIVIGLGRLVVAIIDLLSKKK